MKQAIASRRGRRLAAIVTTSLVGHGLVMLLLGMGATIPPDVRRSEPPALALDLWPPSRTPVRRTVRAPARTMVSPLAPRRALALDPAAVLPAVRSPFPAGSPAPSPDAAGDAHAAPLPGQSGGDLRGALRGSTVGCANRDTVGLTLREREGCDDRYATGRENDPFIEPPMDTGKRAAWDAAAARKDRARKRKEAAPPPGIAPSDNAGGTRTNGLGILGY